MSGSWKSQRFDAEGSTTAAGILRQLGRPTLDEFTILVREAAQNSWDARREGLDVDFTIRIERIGDRAPVWQELLLPGPSVHSVPGFEEAVERDAWYLVISDRGTGGLEGPIRATDRPQPGERNDFVQFLRNVGETRDTPLGGGTYGFGKGIFYRTSTIRTILADSQIRRTGRLERRFFGASLGNDFWDEYGERFTGRHWWGVNAGGIVDPLVGAPAETVANSLGLPGFGRDETGTNIVVLGADLGLVGGEDEPGFTDPHALAAHLASAVLWNLWPKFRSIARAQSAMNFAVWVDGIPMDIPDPWSVLALRPFVESMRALEGPAARPYRRTASPRIHAGDLAVTVGLAPQSEDAIISSARPFDGAPHHVARMRQAGLVVDYLEGPAHADPLAGYGGVFRASAEADDLFASAEPPTHDHWNPEGLDKPSRAVVEGARRWVRDDLSRRFVTAPQRQDNNTATGLGHGSRRLAGLVAGVRATAPDPVGPNPPTGGRGASGGGRGNAAARFMGEPWVDRYQDGLGVFVRVRIEDAAALSSLRGRLDVVLEGGGREAEAPHGSISPTVLAWIAADDSSVVQLGATLEHFRGFRDWIAIGEFSDSLVTRFQLELTGVADGS